MLHASSCFAPYPHARSGVDVSRAKTVSGVHAVVTSQDLNWCEPYFSPAFVIVPSRRQVARYEGADSSIGRRG
jgi:hypothetical protein